MKNRWTFVTLSCLWALAACELETKPATQVMVALNSDMREGSELARVRFEVLDAAGEVMASATQEFALAQDGGVGTHTLPLSFGLVPPERDPADRFRLVAYGYRSFDPEEQPFVEQKVIAAFVKEKTLLLEMFLGRVCDGALCGADSTCYLEAAQAVAPGECGDIPERLDLVEVGPGRAIETAMWPSPPLLGPNTSSGQDGGTDGGPDGGDVGVPDGGDAGAPDGGDAGAPDGGSAMCALGVEVPGDVCEVGDPFEPNDALETATGLNADEACQSIVATLEGNERDYYTFRATKSEAVRLTVEYTAVGDADLEIDWSPSGSADNGRLGPSETEVITRRRQKGEDIEFHVTARDNEGCQPYTLTIEPFYCTDEFEDNDTGEDAALFELADDGTASWVANAYRYDRDFYRVAIDKQDPFLVTGSYTVDIGSSADLDLGLSTVATGARYDQDDRVGTTEQWRLWGFPDGPDEFFLLEVEPSGTADDGECIPYSLQLDARACTDEFEDNDTAAQRASIEAGVTYDVTAIYSDDDYYDVSALPDVAGCTLEYTPPVAGAEPLNISRHRADGTSVSGTTSTSDGAGGTKILTLSWTTPTGYVRIRSSDRDDCVSYTLRCE